MSEVFISYSRKDEDFVRELYERLRKDGVDFFFDLESIGWGENFVFRLEKAIKHCDCIVPILTPDFFHSDWCQEEVTAFYKRDPTNKARTILPLLSKECETPLPFYLDRIQYIDISSKEKYRENYPKILGYLLQPGVSATAKKKSIKQKKFPLAKNFPGPDWNFTGRNELLKNVGNNLLSGGKQLRQVLYGMPGVGKTQIAIKYAYEHINDYNLIGWIEAEDQTHMIKSLQSFAESLPLGEEQLPGKKLVGLVKEWLENNDRWLLIFDNADDAEKLDEFLPRGGYGHVIITSRHKDWQEWANPVEIPPLEIEESVEFLTKIVKREETTQIKKLAERLGYLPLALAFAAKYIYNTGETIENYLEKHAKELLDKNMKLKNYPHRSTAISLKLSIRAVMSMTSSDKKRKIGLEAVKLLNLFSFFSADNIPHKLLIKYNLNIPSILKDVLGDASLVGGAIFALKTQSLIRTDTISGETFHSLHRLIQEIVRNYLLGRRDGNMWCQAAAELLLDRFPFEPEKGGILPQSKLLLPHALSVVDHAEQLGLDTDEVNNISDKAYLCNAILILEEGKPEDSIKSLKKVRAYQQDHVANMHARCLEVAGDCYHLLDQYKIAEEHLKKAGDTWKSLKEYEAMVRSVERLAQIHELSGYLVKAKTLLLETEKVAAVKAPGIKIPPAFWYRKGTVARLHFELDDSKDWYTKALEAAETQNNVVWQAYGLRGMGEIALLQGELEQARIHLEEARTLYEKAKHRGKIWIMRFQAEIYRQKALKPNTSDEEKNRLLGMAEKTYRDYIEKCRNMKNPNGEAWGWLALAFLFLEIEAARERYQLPGKFTTWNCLLKADNLFQKTESKIGFIEVTIGKGLAMAADLSPEPSGKIESLLKKAMDMAQDRHIKLSKQKKILKQIISHEPGTPMSRMMWEEICSPRNPA